MFSKCKKRQPEHFVITQNGDQMNDLILDLIKQYRSKFGILETTLNHVVLKSECVFSSAECDVQAVKFADVFFMFKLP